MVTEPDRSVRRSIAAAAMAAPALAAALWLMVFQLTLPPPYATPESTSSLATAVAQDRIEIAFAHIRAGADPNAPVAFRDDMLTGGREISITPLLIAVAHGHTDSVAMLMSSGVRLDAPGNRFAVCLARRRGFDDLAGHIIEDAGPVPAPTTCPASAGADDPPLAAYAE